MKSTYRLIGVPWDGKPIPGRAPIPVPFDPTVGEAGSEDNLFDLGGRRKYITASALLSCNIDQQIDEFITMVEDCTAVFIALDYHPPTNNPIIIAFYKLRIMQIYQTVYDKLPAATVRLMEAGNLSSIPRIRRLTLPWLMNIAASFEKHCTEFGMVFNADGLPCIPIEAYATSLPDDMIPYGRRHSRLCAHPESTALCHFTGDKEIYPRFEHLLEEIEEYRPYAAAVIPDLTVTADMDRPWQAFIMLLNQLFGAVLAAHGIKIIANTRCGSPESKKYLESIPKRVLWAVGSLGCEPIRHPEDYSFTSKIICLQPQALLTYGKRDRVAGEQLAKLGIRTRRYPDVHARLSQISKLSRTGRHALGR